MVMTVYSCLNGICSDFLPIAQKLGADTALHTPVEMEVFLTAVKSKLTE